MKRRRSSIASDSLDLLLDTITNTFGGILLLAILLVLLVRDPGESDSAADRQAAAEQRAALEQQLQQLAAQREVLQQSLAGQQMFQVGDDGKGRKALMEQLSQMLKQIAALRADTTARAAEQQQTLEQISGHAEQVHQMAATLSQLELEVQNTQAELQQEQALRTRTMDLPKEEITFKEMTVAIAKGSELFLVETNPGLGAMQYNTHHFDQAPIAAAELVLASGIALKVKPGQGIPLTPEALTQGLSGFDRDQVFLTIVVDGDSFAPFHEIRAACVQLGLEYKIFLTENFPVVEGRSNQQATSQ